MSNVKSAQIVMLIVAMLAQTTTAVPEQRLLLPQHWLLAAWDMVARGPRGALTWEDRCLGFWGCPANLRRRRPGFGSLASAVRH